MKGYILLLFIIANIKVYAQDFSADIKIPDELVGNKFYISILDNDKRKVLSKDSILTDQRIFKYEGKLKDVANFIRLETRKKNLVLSNISILYEGKNDLQVQPIIHPTKGLQAIKITGTKSTDILDSLEKLRVNYYKQFSTKSRDVSYLDVKNLLALHTIQMELLTKAPKEFSSLMILYELSLYNQTIAYQTQILKTFKSFSTEIQNTPLGKKLSNHIDLLFESKKSIYIGAYVPKFSIKNSDGILFNNDAIKGNPYLIIFSATWCVPCQEELPSLKEIYKKYKNIGLKVIYINVDDDLKRWKAHIKANKIEEWINVSEGQKAINSEISRKFDVHSLPTYFLIDKESKITYSSILDKNNRIDKLSNTLSKIQ